MGSIKGSVKDSVKGSVKGSVAGDETMEGGGASDVNGPISAGKGAAAVSNLRKLKSVKEIRQDRVVEVSVLLRPRPANVL